MPENQYFESIGGQAGMEYLKKMLGEITKGNKPDMNGLYAKYNVTKVSDGSVVFNSFVLRPEIDPAARVALRAYARTTPSALLAKDIDGWMDELDAKEETKDAHNRTR